MKLITRVFLLVLLTVPALAVAENTVGYWVIQDLEKSSYQGRLCHVYYTAEGILPSVEARDIESVCRVHGGYFLRFTSLQARPPEDPGAAEGFPEVLPQELLQGLNDDEPVPAFWSSVRLTFTRDGQDCHYLAESIEWLLSRFAVRNLQYNVYCNSDSGYLDYRFEALVPAEQKGSAEQEI